MKNFVEIFKDVDFTKIEGCGDNSVKVTLSSGTNLLVNYDTTEDFYKVKVV